MPSRTSLAVPLGSLVVAAFTAALLSCGESTGPATPGPPALIAKIAGDDISGVAGAILTPAPAVRITDARGRAVSDITVTFSVASGEGTVTGSVTKTDEDGVATVGGWTLGLLGPNTLEASASELDPVTFSATSVCAPSGTLGVDAHVSGTLTGTDCQYRLGTHRFFTDHYTFTIEGQATLQFTQTSPDFNSYLELFDGDRLVAFHDDIDPSTDVTARLRVIVPAGTYRVAASSGPADEVGHYELRAVHATTFPGCEPVWVVPGINTFEHLDSVDCSDGTYYTELYGVYLIAGRHYGVTLSSTEFDTHLTIGRGGAEALTDIRVDDSSDGMNSTLDYVPVVSGLHFILASSGRPLTSGGFFLMVDR